MRARQLELAERQVVDPFEIRVAMPEITCKIRCAGGFHSFKDALQGQSLERYAIGVAVLKIDELAFIDFECSHHTAIEPGPNGNEHGAGRDALIDGQLSEHVFAPKLLKT